MPALKVDEVTVIRRIRRQNGFTLLEALIAIALLGFAFATTIAFHGALLGSAGENRLRAAAMSLAEAKLEELRAQPFASLGPGSSDTRDLSGFGFFSLTTIQLRRCWDVTEESPTLKRVRVAVSRGAEICAPWADSALVTLTTFVAQNNFAQGGTKTLADEIYNPDGRGKIISYDPADPPPAYAGAPLLPGGFEVLEHEGGFSLCDPIMGQCLVPTPDDDRDGAQDFATISGNIFISARNCISGSGSVPERCGISILAEGNALCRLHYPDDSLGAAAPALPSVIGLESLTYIRYSCVVADQWRRTIGVSPAAGEKACVGNPRLILGEAGDTDDQLRSRVRFYDGRQPLAVDPDDGSVIEQAPHGVKGGPLTGELQAVVGSVCMVGDPCWSDTASRGLVPGGHHFLLMPESGGNCSARMKEVELLDGEAETRFAPMLARNPDIFHCTSSKDYFGDFCIGVTRISGFIGNQASIDVDADDISILASNVQVASSCSYFGPFGNSGGGYLCAARHPSIPTVAAVSNNESLTFASPSSYLFSGATAPVQFPLDITAREFTIIDAAIPPTAIFPDPSCLELACSFDGIGSTGGASADGGPAIITSYSWSFGDGTNSTGSTVNHVYAAAGTYTVTLTVTNSLGLTDDVSRVVTVTSETEGNLAPIPAFSHACEAGLCTFDASASSDDGEIVSYAWDFGDGSSGAGLTVTHEYGPLSDSYNVTLTVTDDEGASATLTRQVTIEATVTTCTIVQTGRVPSGNYRLEIVYQGRINACTHSGRDYTCTMSAVVDGTEYVVRNTAGQDDIDDRIVAMCGNEPTTVTKNY